MKELIRLYGVHVILLAAALSGCSDPLKISSESQQVTVSGKVFNGSVRNAAVKIFTLDEERNKSLLGETTTNNSGEYSLTVSRYNDPVLVEVTQKDDGTTTIVCSAPQGCDTDRDEKPDVDFGKDYPYTLTLNAVVANLVGDKNVEVSPLTHISASYIEFIGYDQQYINMTNARVAKVFGLVDIVGSSAIDITNRQQLTEVNAFQVSALTYGYLNAGLLTLSQQKTYGQFGDMLDLLSRSYKQNGGEFYFNFPLYYYTNHVTIEEIALATLSVLNSNLTDTTAFDGTINTELMNMLTKAQQSPGGSITHTIVDVENSDIARAKNLVGEVRRWSTQLVDLENSSKHFGDRLNTAKNLSEKTFSAVGKQMIAALTAAVQAYKINQQNAQNTFLLQDFLPNRYTQSSGTIVIDGQMVRIVDGIIDNATVVLELSMPDQSGTQFEVTVNKGIVQSQNGYISLDQGDAKIQFSKDVGNLYQDNIQLPAVQSAKLELGVTMGYFNEIQAVDFEGRLEASVVNFNPKKFYLNGQFTVGEESFQAAFETNMQNAESYRSEKPLSYGSLRSGLVSYEFSNEGNSITMKYPDSTITDTYNSQVERIIRTTQTRFYGRSYTWEEVIQQKYVSLNDFLAHSYQVPAIRYLWVSGEGYYWIERPAEWNAEGGEIDGVMVSPDDRDESQENWRDIDGTLSLQAQIAGLPLAMISVTADRNSFNTINLSSNISYQNVDINLSLTFGDIDNFIDSDGRLIRLPIFEILNPYEINLVTTVSDPVENISSRMALIFDVSSGDSPGIVVVDGKLVGIIGSENKTGAPIVTYVDGTFESIAF